MNPTLMQTADAAHRDDLRRRRQVRQWLMSLSEQDRLILHLLDNERLTPAEAAVVLDLEPVTVARRHTQLLRLLRGVA